MENTIYMSADDEINSFILSRYTPEYARVLQTALQVLYTFEVSGVQDGLCELIYLPESLDDNLLISSFDNFILLKLEHLAAAHGIETEASIEQLSELLVSLLRVQNAADPVPYMRILDTLGSPEDKLCQILSDFCTLDETRLLSIVTSVSPALLKRLYERLELLENKDVEPMPVNTEVDAHLRQFYAFVDPQLKGALVGFQAATHGVKTGHSFETYVRLLEGFFDVQDAEMTSLNLLSVIYMTPEGEKAPLDVYRQHSETLIHPTQLQAVDIRIRSIVEQFEHFKKAQNDALHLSPVQH